MEIGASKAVQDRLKTTKIEESKGASLGSMSILWAQKVELFSQHNICRENYFLGC